TGPIRRGRASPRRLLAAARRRQVDASTPRFGQTDRDRLLRRSRAVFALAHVIYFFSDELAGLGARTLALTPVAPGPLERSLLWQVAPARRAVRGVCQRLGFRRLLLVRVRDGEAGGGVGLDAVRRDRVAQTILVERREPLDDLRQKARRNGHEQLVVGHPAVATLGVARNRQRRLAGLQRFAPRIRARGLTDRRERHLPVAAPLQAVDEENHLAGRAVDQADIRRIQST